MALCSPACFHSASLCLKETYEGSSQESLITL